MKHVPREQSAVPAGFDTIWVDSRTAMLVPTSIAREKAEALRHHQQEEDARRQVERQQEQLDLMARGKRERRAQEAKARLRRSVLRHPPRAGWYRVLPGLAELERETSEPAAMNRSADKDINERRKRIVQQLLERGADRKVALPEKWRLAVDELEYTLPHFRQPIRALRNALALAQATGTPPRIAPQLLLGPPGVGKTFYSHRVAELLGTTRGSVQFDQPGAGSQLRGSDKYWSNSEPGLLFNLICLGDMANPVVLLDEIDKAGAAAHRHGQEQLAQLHGALERETSRSLRDISVDIEFDASLVTYIATANSLQGIGVPIVSRMDVSIIEPPGQWESINIATSISRRVLHQFNLDGQLDFDRHALYVLAHLSPRLMVRAAEQSVAAAVANGRTHVSEADVWNELGGTDQLALH